MFKGSAYILIGNFFFSSWGFQLDQLPEWNG